MKFWRKPLDIDEVSIPQGDVYIIKDRCKGCGFCVEYCPQEALAMSDEYNTKGYHFPIVKKPADCLECHLCEMLCPDFAIFVVLKEEKKLANPKEVLDERSSG